MLAAGGRNVDAAKRTQSGAGKETTVGDMMQGKVAIVTGSGGGIGRDIALALAREGARLVINDVGASVAGEGASTGPAQQVVDEIRAAGGEVVANTDSVADAAAAQRIVSAALDAFGRIDCIVNNAGILRDRFFHKMSVDEFDAVIKVHLYGSYYVSRAAAPHFKEQNAGAMVHMTSTSGLIGNYGQANYSAAKLGIMALSKSIALDMQKFNVRSNCIAPFAWSRMIGTIPAETDAEKARIERMKQMTPAKIAPLAVALCSDASATVTGQVFAVRNNEIFLMSQPRPVRSVHRGEGWTPESVAQHALPALQASFYPLDRSSDVFSWEPI
jgi:NAD(P)-dependent dehydrogenase (short-subunit alcohol dehydrogenase family)